MPQSGGTKLGAGRSADVPRFHIRTINHEYDSVDEGGDYPSIEAARDAAIKAGAAISASDLCEGRSASIIEMRVEQSGKVVHRLAIAATMSPLKLSDENAG